MSAFVYLGTSEFAATVLRVLVERGLEPALVITPPDRRQGRGRRVSPAPAALRAGELGLAVHRSDDVNQEDSRQAIADSGAMVAMVCAFGQLIREPLLSQLPLLNVHPSLLPRWRGAAPIERALMAGDAETGVCIIELEAGLDSGPVVTSARIAIEPEDDFGTLSERLAQLGGELAAEAITAALGGQIESTPQSEEGLTYAEKIDKQERRLDPGLPAEELAAKLRALTPHIGAYLELEGGERLTVTQATPVDLNGGHAPGALIQSEGELILACAAGGGLNLQRVKPPGGREMPIADYLRGHQPPTRVGGKGSE